MKKQQAKKNPASQSKKVQAGANKKSDIKWELFIAAVAIVSFGFSVFNLYALDDFIVLVQNSYVQKGVAGIWNILSKDTFAGMYAADVMVLAGGRYRPLSLVTFAMEHSLWGNSPGMAHFINVALFVATGILLFRLLKKLLSFYSPTDPWTNVKAGLISILFVALPVHSEPVINIKGRDDLMCLLFFILSIFQLLKYVNTKSNRNFFLTSFYYFLALMSKETALTFVAIFPLILFFFTSAGRELKFRTTAVYFMMALLFLLFRYLATKDNHGTVSTDVLNDPFVHANVREKYATIFVTWIYYLKMLVWPRYFSYDYNYNQIPLTNFGDWRTIFSIILHVVLIGFAFITLKRKSIYSFSILFYFIIFSILSNFFFNIGSIFADRFLYIPSLGFCIAVVYLGFDILEKLKSESSRKSMRTAGMSVFTILIIIGCARNYYRCQDWKDNNSLFIADTEGAPRSAKIQLNAGLAYITLAQQTKNNDRDSLLYKAMERLQKGIEIYPTYIDGYQNMGVVNNYLGNNVEAEKWWSKVKQINPTYTQIENNNKVLSYFFFQTGIQLGAKKDYAGSIFYLNKAQQYDSLNADLCYNLGGAYFSIQKNDSARFYFQKALQINPQYYKATEGLRAIDDLKK